jgi:death on curing protein
VKPTRSDQEPTWLSPAEVAGIHESMLEQHGGLQGLRDAGALESALGRPTHRWHYDRSATLAVCAAAYGFALAKNHPFADGNKRTAFVSMVVFYEKNGPAFNAAEAEAVVIMLAVAAGRMTEAELAAWIRTHTATSGARGRRPRKRR